jgi:hypothetical protein
MPAMAEELLRPLDENTARALEEAAKTLGRGLDLVGGLGAYMAQALGGVPQNLVGLLIGDWLIHKRVRRWADLQAETKRYLDQRGVPEPYEDVSPSVAVPLIEAAVDEDRPELADLWARLLAAALDPKRRANVRQNVIRTLKQMEPLDAAVLQAVYENGGAQWTPSGRDYLAIKLKCAQDEVLVSFQNLQKLGCIGFQVLPHTDPLIQPMGRLLMQAVR